MNVGVSWRGGNRPEIKRRKSTRLQQWSELLSTSNVTFVNLQYGLDSEERTLIDSAESARLRHWRHPDPLTEFDDFASLVGALDLVISVSNTTAHLAGALGVPVWVLLPDIPDWRWQLERSDSAWYASARLFRQQTAGDWKGVLRDVGAELRGLGVLDLRPPNG
ncbi:MAG: hypothetical protein CMJ48_12380 [Planctomycetaceae bacterium]|nr:hypothetical protein [Planctomycetaceae bacterium]